MYRNFKNSNRLFVDMDWGTDITAGEYLIFEVFRKLDPDTYTDIYDYEREVLVQFQIQQQIKDIQIQQVLSYLLSTL